MFLGEALNIPKRPLAAVIGGAKISSKVELYVGRGNTYSSATFKRLGYLSLDSNERSSYQARELKTVFIDHIGSYIKLIVNENHPNKLNIHNQVGIVAVSLMGAEDDIMGSEAITSKDNRALGQIIGPKKINLQN